jgi:hypothetical protein
LDTSLRLTPPGPPGGTALPPVQPAGPGQRTRHQQLEEGGMTKWEIIDENDRVLDTLREGDPELLHALNLGFRIRQVGSTDLLELQEAERR